jgi:hypothetical protein
MNLKLVRTTSLLLLSIIFFSAACSKSSKDSAPTKAELISTSTWKFKEAGLDNDGNGQIDVQVPASAIDACLLDNTLTFKADKTGTIDEGPKKCNTTDPQTSPFTWSLNADETQINFSTAVFAGIGGDAKLLELSATNLTLSKTLTLTGFPFPVPVILKLVH